MTNPTPILVTGATGYVAGEIIKQLLERGIPVRATVRDIAQKEKYAHLDKLSQETGTPITYFEADLLKPDSFDDAVNGCEHIIHTASPFKMQVNNPEKELLQPAVSGVDYVLSAAKKAKTIKRIVLTSSCYAIYGDNADAKTLTNNRLDEGNWNTSSSIDHQPYAFSKVSAEQRAWEISNAQQQWDLITINPGFILGPATNPNANFESKAIMQNIGNGLYKTGVPNIQFGVVDVRNVAEAHINAALAEFGSGRYILSNQVMSFLDIANMLRKAFPNYPLPKRNVPKWLVWLLAPTMGITRKFIAKNVNHPIQLDNSKSKKQLNIDYIPVEDTLISFFQQLVDAGEI